MNSENIRPNTRALIAMNIRTPARARGFDSASTVNSFLRAARHHCTGQLRANERQPDAEAGVRGAHKATQRPTG